MSRRTAGLTALAAALVVGGFVPVLMGGASAAGGCPSWTDPAGDGVWHNPTFGAPIPSEEDPTGVTADDNMDIVGASFASTASTITAVVKVKKLSASGSDAGDEYHINFTVGGKTLQIYADRGTATGLPAPASALPGTGAGLYNVTDDKLASGKAVATYNISASTVTITSKIADVAALAGVPIASKPVTGLLAESVDHADGVLLIPYDGASTKQTLTMAVDCAGGGGGAPAPAPSATPTPSATPSPSPTPKAPPAPPGFPRTGCATFTDPKGDGTPAIAGPAAAPNEPDLDITSVAVQTTGDVIKAFLKVDKLGDLPANFEGDRFEFEFLVGTKKFTFAGGRLSAAAAVVTANPNRGQLNGTTNPDLKPTATFDTTNSTVILEIDRAKLEKVNAGPIPDGTVVTGVVARTWGLQPGLQFPADTAQATAAADRVYTIGVSPCFPPPPALLANAGAVTSQYGDLARVAVKLTSSARKALVGRSVTLGLAGRVAVAKTDSAGVARALIPVTVSASDQVLSVVFAGDATAARAAITVPFRVVEERTRLALAAVAKQGTARTVVATLLDDDNKPVAGQRVVFAVNGKAVATMTTSSAGKATFTEASPGQTVQVTFAGVSGRWLGATAQLKV